MNKLRGVPVFTQEYDGRILITLCPSQGMDTQEAELVLECACFSKINTRTNYLAEKAAGFWVGCSDDAYEGTGDAYRMLLPLYRDLPVERLQQEIQHRKEITDALERHSQGNVDP